MQTCADGYPRIDPRISSAFYYQIVAQVVEARIPNPNRPAIARVVVTSPRAAPGRRIQIDPQRNRRAQERPSHGGDSHWAICYKTVHAASYWVHNRACRSGNNPVSYIDAHCGSAWRLYCRKPRCQLSALRTATIHREWCRRRSLPIARPAVHQLTSPQWRRYLSVLLAAAKACPVLFSIWSLNSSGGIGILTLALYRAVVTASSAQ